MRGDAQRAEGVDLLPRRLAVKPGRGPLDMVTGGGVIAPAPAYSFSDAMGYPSIPLIWSWASFMVEEMSASVLTAFATASRNALLVSVAFEPGQMVAG